MKKIIFTFIMIAIVSNLVTAGTDLKISGDIRMQGYSMFNYKDFDDLKMDKLRSYRLRTRVRFDAAITEDLKGCVVIANQNWGNTDAVGMDYDGDFFVDQAYIEVKNIFIKNLSLKLGRQNLMYGNGFVIYDGRPEVSSTTNYFDAVKATYIPRDGHQVDIIAAKITDTIEPSNQNDEDLIGVYYMGKDILSGNLDVYYLTKKVRGNLDINTIGAKYDAGLMEDCLNVSVEIAKQNGDNDLKGDAKIDRDALAYEIRLDYKFQQTAWNPVLSVGYTSYSGDDDGTNDSEAWEPVYSRYPRFGDLAFYSSLGLNGTLGGWTDLNIIKLALNVCPTEQIKSTVGYQIWTQNETAGGESDDIGNIVSLTADYTYNKNLSFQVLAEQFDPGDHINKDLGKGTDIAQEIRWQANLKF